MKKIPTWTDKALQFYGKRRRKRLAEGVGTDRNLPRPKIVHIAASFHAAAKASEKAAKAAENASEAKAAAEKAACASADAKAAYKYAKKLKKHPRKLVKAHFQAKRKWLLGPAVEEAEQQNTKKEEAAGAPVDLSSFRDVSLFGPPPLGPWGGPGGAGPMALPPSQSHDR